MLAADPMKLALSPSKLRRAAALLLVAGWLPGLSAAATAAVSSTESAVHWLQAELPSKVTLLNADCAQLAAAVGKATLVHQPEAPAILLVALTRGVRKRPRDEGKLPCAWTERIFRVSVAAAPTQASALLDLATELYPACATELAGALHDYDRVSYDYKDRVNDKNVVDDKNGPVRDISGLFDPTITDPSGNGIGRDSTTAAPDTGDLTARDISGLGYGDYLGFGSGFGPGFPGSPGFIGSPPDGGLALPPAPVTAAANS